MTLTDDEIRSLPERMGNWVTQDQCWGDLRALCEEVLRLRTVIRETHDGCYRYFPGKHGPECLLHELGDNEATHAD